MDQLTNEPAKVEQVKVYELAKELGMDSITLIDKLKRFHIEVKSHMSELAAEQANSVREQIAKEQALQKKAAKTPRAVATKRKAAEKDKEKAEEPAAPKKTGPTVIRRRARAAGEEAPTQTIAPTKADASGERTGQEAQSEAAEAAQDAAAGRPRPEAQEQGTAADASQGPSKESAAPESAPLKGSGLKLPSLLGARSEGLTTSRATGSILNIVKDEKKRALPKVTPNVRPNVPGQGPTVVPRGNVGIVNLGKEAIDRLVEEEQVFKKKGGAGRGEREKSPTDVRVADYRAKKELVFLPKKKKVPVNKEVKRTEITTPAAHKRVIRMEGSVTVSELAQRMGVKSGELVKKLIGMGVMATLNHPLDHDSAVLLATDFGYEIENVAFKEEAVIPKIEDKSEDLVARPPIVTVMGHVDHGKTSLLDAIRSANVATGEAGGITQHIGAYTVDVAGDKGEARKITFIDTPGHEAFTVMRARGANVTDIVILVVAADDGVMPQTREAVDHARAANVPILVAVNKVDKPGANPDKVMKGLSEVGLLSEAWGGENIFVNVSALKKTGIKELLESVLLQADVLDLKANPNRAAEGTVLEARLERSRGAVVNVLVKKGTLKVGDPVVAGVFCGKARAMVDDKGQSLKSVGPGFAAELLGLEGVPQAGDTFNVTQSEAEARDVAEHRLAKAKPTEEGKPTKMSLEDFFAKAQQSDLKELSVLLKTDVVGSLEAIRDSLAKVATEKVKVKLLSASTGGISESDVMLASASNAIILGFNVRPDTKARAMAEAEEVDVRCYSIIYELLDDVKKAMTGLLDKKEVEKYVGRAEVRELFSVPKVGVIAGSAVVDGKIARGCQVRLLRENRVVYTGRLSSLKRFKDDAKEVAQGYECGIGIENYNDLKQGDVIEAFTTELVAQELGAAVAPAAKPGAAEPAARA